MMKVYIDTCAYINITNEENKQIYDLLNELIKKNEVEVFISHAIPDDGLKRDISGIFKKTVPTGTAVFGYSRFGMSRLGDVNGVYEKLVRDIPDKSKNKQAIWDAIHYSTAHFEKVDFFVTDDKKLRRKIDERIENPIKTINLKEFYTELKKIESNENKKERNKNGQKK